MNSLFLHVIMTNDVQYLTRCLSYFHANNITHLFNVHMTKHVIGKRQDRIKYIDDDDDGTRCLYTNVVGLRIYWKTEAQCSKKLHVLNLSCGKQGKQFHTFCL